LEAPLFCYVVYRQEKDPLIIRGKLFFAKDVWTDTFAAAVATATAVAVNVLGFARKYHSKQF